MRSCPVVLLSLFLLLLSVRLGAEEEPLFRSLQNGTGAKEVLIERVINADTIKLDTGEKYKLIGLKAPDAPPKAKVEYDADGKIIIPEIRTEDTIEEKAYVFAAKLMQGKRVRLEFDSNRKDEEFNDVAYVFLKDGTFVNEEILRQGYANLKIRPPNLKYADRLRAAYQEARRGLKGLQGE